MQLDPWVTAVGGLVGALIGASAALGAQYFQSRQARKQDAERERKHAIEEVIVRALAIDMRVHEMTVLAANAGSLDGLLARLLGTVVPLDYAAMFDTLHVEADGLNRAAAQVWLFGDEDTVKLTNAVTLAATDVIDAHTQPKTNWILNLFRVALLGRPARDVERIESSRKGLAQARRTLVDHTRRKLNLEDVDLFAVPIEKSD